MYLLQESQVKITRPSPSQQYGYETDGQPPGCGVTVSYHARPARAGESACPAPMSWAGHARARAKSASVIVFSSSRTSCGLWSGSSSSNRCRPRISKTFQSTRPRPRRPRRRRVFLRPRWHHQSTRTRSCRPRAMRPCRGAETVPVPLHPRSLAACVCIHMASVPATSGAFTGLPSSIVSQSSETTTRRRRRPGCWLQATMYCSKALALDCYTSPSKPQKPIFLLQSLPGPLWTAWSHGTSTQKGSCRQYFTVDIFSERYGACCMLECNAYCPCAYTSPSQCHPFSSCLYPLASPSAFSPNSPRWLTV